jgi:chromosome segregation ATPase
LLIENIDECVGRDQQVRLAHEVAVELNHKLKELAAQATNNSFRVIEEVVSSALDRITDSKEAIATFATVLESKLFNQAVSKTEIKTLMSAAIEKFNQNEKQLQDLRRFHSDGQIIAGNELEELLDDIDECMAKCAKHHASLHHLAEFNANISKQIERLKSAVPEALIKVPKKEELPELEMVIADCKHDLSSNNKAPLDAASIKVSTYEGGFFNRSKLCSRSIDIIENYRHEPNLVRRRSP